MLEAIGTLAAALVALVLCAQSYYLNHWKLHSAVVALGRACWKGAKTVGASEPFSRQFKPFIDVT